MQPLGRTAAIEAEAIVAKDQREPSGPLSVGRSSRVTLRKERACPPNARDRHREADRQGPRFAPPDDANAGSSERAARSGPPEKAGDFESGRWLRESAAGDPRRQDRSTPIKVRRGRRRRSGARMASMNPSGVAHGLDPGADIIRCGCIRTGRPSRAFRGIPWAHEPRPGSLSGSDRAPMAVIRGLGPSCFWGEPRRGARFEELCVRRGRTGQAFPVEGLSVRTGAPGVRRSGS